MTQDQVFTEALALDAEARAKLAEKLVSSLPDSGEVDAAWLAEVRNRDAAYAPGEVTASPVQTVLERVGSRARN